MNRYSVLLDANVLYPAPLRDALMQLAVTDLFKAQWTDDIHREWIAALLRKDPQRDPAALERTRRHMDTAVRDSLVTGYRRLIPSLDLPDPDDRHILAAAIVGRCDAIITQNLKDFPAAALAPFGIEAQHPDDFFCNQLSLAPGLVCSALGKVRARLQNPPKTADEYLATLTRQGLVAPVRTFRDRR
ncbi:MAG: PIN domain-containing protein [Rhodospirillales bacterium]|nr:PIN domain-containing protein [Rhodospirillales bacterium]